MKRLIFVMLIFFGFVLYANSQNLFTVTYSTLTKDTIAITTNGGSDWFSNEGYQHIWLEVWNGTSWLTFEVDYPTKTVYQISGYFWLADSSISVLGKLEGGISVKLPIRTTATTRAYSVSLVTCSACWVRFRGYYNRDL
jgi:hypothetical protein